MKQAVRIFLRERMGWITLVYVNLGLVFLLIALVLSFEKTQMEIIKQEIGYGLLFSTVLLLLFLVIQFWRRFPYYRVLQKGAYHVETVDDFAEWGETGSDERKLVTDVVQNLYRLAVAERQQFQEARKQHLEFINLWVHQMKTPVATLSLFTQQTKGMTNEERERLKGMEEEIEKLNEGLDMVLSMARLTDFAIDYQIRPVSLMESVRDVIQTKKKQFIRNGIFPRLEAEEKDWTVLTDPKWNRFVIDQIVQNALKYASQVNQRSYVHIGLQYDEKMITLSIRDEGPGIPAHDLSRIFHPFFTGENGRKYAQATGMGLYLVKKVLDQLNHEIKVESKQGQGTTVCIKYKKPS
ncbi:sensor histidine kinase [Paenactinomyces guangxiensis]|uniref:histidine kinase n=1 Tax=Paenactinomyces guangxiensis TaxID=1490290 RepID=A0A7W1WPS5_9BACL|nr:sensor histidine kinase [Paenactinomyces guangxiensis]MBA4493661.1 sensor histidine kinase [Paenactinomyces guangxiensis]MBH8590948.1 sensor histidine kinase [Paenactinomyces guangxiensis]